MVNAVSVFSFCHSFTLFPFYLPYFRFPFSRSVLTLSLLLYSVSFCLCFLLYLSFANVSSFRFSPYLRVKFWQNQTIADLTLLLTTAFLPLPPSPHQVQLLYNDDTLGHRIKFVLKRLEILYKDPTDLHRPYDIDNLLTNFCSWQRKENPPRDSDPLHWDHALILTGLDVFTINSKGRVNSQVVGEISVSIFHTLRLRSFYLWV